jgi:SAM-dependent methyltransferase
MGNKSTLWYKDDNLWKTLRPFLFTEDLWARAQEEVNNIISLLDIKGNSRILDLCCGTGRHSLELASRGFSVTGVDIAKDYIKEAKKKAKTMGVDVEFIVGDMKKFCRPDSYDVVINMFSSFGYFRNQDDDRNVLLNIYQSLDKGGKLLIDLMGKEILACIFQKRDWIERDGTILLKERYIKKDWSWIENRWILIKGRVRKEFTVSHRLYSGNEIAYLLESSNFHSIEIYGDLAGSIYDNDAKRLIAIASK